METPGTRPGKLHKWLSTDLPFLTNPTFPPHMASHLKMPNLVPAPALPHCLPAKLMLHVHISPWPHCILPLPKSSASPAPPESPGLSQRPSQRALSLELLLLPSSQCFCKSIQVRIPPSPSNQSPAHRGHAGGGCSLSSLTTSLLQGTAMYKCSQGCSALILFNANTKHRIPSRGGKTSLN